MRFSRIAWRVGFVCAQVSCAHLSWISTDGVLLPSEDEAVRRSAQRDIPCTSDITVRRLGRVMMGAEGCGVRVTYASDGSSNTSTTANHYEYTLVLIARVPIDAPIADVGTATPN
jgi:hypothetical protein